jgi:C4-dicarboxylate-specific signal transduction histidine kinase
MERVLHARNQSGKTGIFESEYRIFKSDGSVRWVHSPGFPIMDDNGTVYRMSGIAEDITGRKLELQKITEAGRLLSVGELASGVAHEINNPLAIIQLNAEEGIENSAVDSVSENLRVIKAHVPRVSTIVRNLLWFVRESTTENETASPNAIIERCLELKRHDFEMNNISVSLKIQLGSTDLAIYERLITQVLLNILTNAEQACMASHGKGQIWITEQEINGMTKISVSDDGGGIQPEILDKVFDPFFTTKAVGQGTGLGLSVSYGIISQLGGNLWAESDGVSGATFHVEVPTASN